MHRHHVDPTATRRPDHPPQSVPVLGLDDSRLTTCPREDVIDAVFVRDRPLADCPGLPF
jgi:hypothetical protein